MFKFNWEGVNFKLDLLNIKSYILFCRIEKKTIKKINVKLSSNKLENSYSTITEHATVAIPATLYTHRIRAPFPKALRELCLESPQIVHPVEHMHTIHLFSQINNFIFHSISPFHNRTLTAFGGTHSKVPSDVCAAVVREPTQRPSHPKNSHISLSSTICVLCSTATLTIYCRTGSVSMCVWHLEVGVRIRTIWLYNI